MRQHRLSADTERLLRRAAACARTMGHSYVGTEHLLLAMLQEPNLRVGRTLSRYGLEAESMKSVVLCEIGRGRREAALWQGLSPGVKRVLARSGREAGRLRARVILPEHLLMALLREERCTASLLLCRSGAELSELFTDVYCGLQQKIPAQTVGREATTRLLESFCEDMTARSHTYAPVIGREREIEELIQILCRKHKNNPAIIGEPGVGKTALVEGLAGRLASGEVPDGLRDRKLYCINMASVLAGTKYRGEFEERIRDLLAEIRRCGNIILFVDEMHTIVGAGNAEGAIDAANLLKPALGRGELQMIGATTLEEYRKYIEKDAALERRFRPLTVREPTKQEAEQILRGLRPGLEDHHRIKIADDAITAAVELSTRYLTDRFLPDKALDLLDEGAAGVFLRGRSSEGEQARRQLSEELEAAVEKSDFERAAVLRDKLQDLLRQSVLTNRARKNTQVTAQDIADMVSRRTGIPVGRLTQSEQQRLLGLQEALSGRIVGQEAAVSAVCQAVLRGRNGLSERKRPMASLLFLGPTGVGKTELCKALADCVYGSGDALVRLDMTEYTEPNSASRLIGAPPGYIGHDEGGTLTEKVRRRPYCVVLLDELEKAHREVTGLLLQIMEDGRLTDSFGRTVDFRNTLIIMTSNLGSGQLGKPGLGFTPGAEEDQIRTVLRSAFSPEFLGRIDCITAFRRLGEENLQEICRRQLEELCRQAKARNLELSYEQNVCRLVAQRCGREESGARSIRHILQQEVEGPVAEYLLRDPTCGRMRVGTESEKLIVSAR